MSTPTREQVYHAAIWAVRDAGGAATELQVTEALDRLFSQQSPSTPRADNPFVPGSSLLWQDAEPPRIEDMAPGTTRYNVHQFDAGRFSADGIRLCRAPSFDSDGIPAPCHRPQVDSVHVTPPPALPDRDTEIISEQE